MNKQIFVVRAAGAQYPTSMGEWGCIAQAWPCLCEPKPFSFFIPWKWHLPEPFIAQGRAVTMSPKARQVASGQVKPYAVGTHWPGVVNDIFNSVGTPGLVTCFTALGQ
jgi:hypothetical protein